MNEIERAIKDFEDFKVAGYTHCALPSSWHIELAITALRAQLARENPKPLTLDELRERAETCKPVYVCRIDKTPMFRERVYCGAVLDYVAAYGLSQLRIQAIYGRNLTLAEGDYGKTWLAYDYPPKEAAHER